MLFSVSFYNKNAYLQSRLLLVVMTSRVTYLVDNVITTDDVVLTVGLEMNFVERTVAVWRA